MDNNTFESILKDYHITDSKIKVLEARKKELRADILKNIVADNVVREFGSYVCKVQGSEVKRIDSKALKQELPSLYDRFLKATYQEKVTVKLNPLTIRKDV